MAIKPLFVVNPFILLDNPHLMWLVACTRPALQATSRYAESMSGTRYAMWPFPLALAVVVTPQPSNFKRKKARAPSV